MYATGIVDCYFWGDAKGPNSISSERTEATQAEQTYRTKVSSNWKTKKQKYHRKLRHRFASFIILISPLLIFAGRDLVRALEAAADSTLQVPGAIKLPSISPRSPKSPKGSTTLSPQTLTPTVLSPTPKSPKSRSPATLSPQTLSPQSSLVLEPIRKIPSRKNSSTQLEVLPPPSSPSIQTERLPKRTSIETQQNESTPSAAISPTLARRRLSLPEGSRTKMTEVILEDFKSDEGHKVNQYILLKNLGVGTYGKVKLAKDTITGQHRAIKVLRKERLKRMRRFLPGQVTDAFQDMQIEIAVMKKLYHPNGSCPTFSCMVNTSFSDQTF